MTGTDSILSARVLVRVLKRPASEERDSSSPQCVQKCARNTLTHTANGAIMCIECFIRIDKDIFRAHTRALCDKWERE